MRIAIFGSTGFLGTKAHEILSPKHEVLMVGLHGKGYFAVDATKEEEVRAFILKYKPEIVLDTVALTSSMQCENNPLLAEQLNYMTAKNISEVCEEFGTWLVFMSSSYLFDGIKGNYNETDQTKPINEYARTKIMAEQFVLKNPKSLVLRVDIMYGFNSRDKKNGVFDMILSSKPINLRDPSQIRQPVFVDDVPRIMMTLVSKKQTGIFHLAGPQRMTMIDFLKGLETAVRENSLVGVDTKPVADTSQKTPPIPKNATFDTNKIKNLGINFTNFEDGLKLMRQRLQRN